MFINIFIIIFASTSTRTGTNTGSITTTTTTTPATTAAPTPTFRFLLIVPERLRGNEFTKITLNGSPRGRFEHSGVLPGAKLHAEHDGNSETMS